ncbi:MAG: radical SAM protein [Candidatus Sedimenticola sp. (ex Thyasira tokunagai)]
MKILLINPFRYFSINRHLHRSYPLPAVTLPYLASFIPDRHQVEIIDEAFGAIDFDTPADLVGITTLSVNAHRAYEIAAEFRKRGCKVVMGGPHVSAVPDEAKAHCDTVAIGNAESTFPTIIADMEQGNLKDFYHNTQPSVIPDSVNATASSSWQTSILASRGCELSCDFCSMQHIFGSFYLQRDAAPTVEDIRKVKTPIISFVDDNFYGATSSSQSFYDEVLETIAETGKQWMAQVRLPILRNEKILKKFRDSNCIGLFVGFESINPENRATMGKQKVDKVFYQDVIERVHAHGIGVIGSFIFGFDEDTPETIDETLDFCIDTRMEMTAFSILTPYPGTEIYRQMKAQQRLLSEDWRLYDSDNAVYQPKYFTPRQLEEKVLEAAKAFYSVPSILKRMKFGMNYSPVKMFLAPNLIRKYSLTKM